MLRSGFHKFSNSVHVSELQRPPLTVLMQATMTARQMVSYLSVITAAKKQGCARCKIVVKLFVGLYAVDLSGRCDLTASVVAVIQTAARRA